ncbi:DUF2202 domain-containing protein [Leifsonia sp. H3M29-4]|uniref:DUF2202 domain-containing protein n=1 Tax=Salinibacterium metalliresistens TaxID=3031321 RepID=UPI0023DA745E|nr:DUF2202 domain-containing protein [Salinibacterium metalliresistens]MDF1478521.1 DUF2202 domain-containing protein [Salinibacterium metalliresistens]
MNKRTIIITSIAVGAVLIAGTGVAVAVLSTPQAVPVASAPATPEPEITATATPTAEPDPIADTAASLLFMIEEEKLAHDVYVTLGSIWGSNIFANIAESEVTHQGLVLPLLQTRGLTDPRSTEVGVFTNPDLQTLYDELIARGSTSQAEAIQVGILIEEKDIADIAAAIAVEDEADVISVYERLLSGSENHLAAFQRQA